MQIKDIYNVMDLSSVSRFVITPKTQSILGVSPSSGRFVSINTSDRDKISQILDIEVEQISILDNMMYITV